MISKRDGVPSLMFRMANVRSNQIVEAQIHVVLARQELTVEGEEVRRFHDLSLSRHRNAIFAYSWTAIHPIDTDSPLFGATPESLSNPAPSLIVSLTGIDETFSQTIYARYSYSPRGYRLGRAPGGHYDAHPRGTFALDMSSSMPFRPKCRPGTSRTRRPTTDLALVSSPLSRLMLLSHAVPVRKGRHKMEIAWIGTGIMGAPMARRLASRRAIAVRVYNRTPQKARALAADGAVVAADVAEAARGAEVVFIMVPDTPDVEAVVAADRTGSGARPTRHRYEYDCPRGRTHDRRTARGRGFDYLDAPVSGGETGAIEGTLTIMVGGTEAAFARARPLFELLGQAHHAHGSVRRRPDDQARQSDRGRGDAGGRGRGVALRAQARSRSGQGARSDRRGRRGVVAAEATSDRKSSPRITVRGFSSTDAQGSAAGRRGRHENRSRACRASRLMTSMFNSAAALGHDLDGTQQAVAAALDSIATLK